MKVIYLTRKQFAIVDDDDFERLSKIVWCAWYDPKGHCFYARGSRKTRMHREVLGAKKGQMVDHKNGCTLDNRKENLRFCTPSQNQANRILCRTNKTGYQGVTYRPKYKKKKYMSVIRHDNKIYQLGVFNTAKEAHQAYVVASRKFNGEFSRV